VACRGVAVHTAPAPIVEKLEEKAMLVNAGLKLAKGVKLQTRDSKTVSPGVVRRAARRSEMKVMFAVRVRLVGSRSGPDLRYKSWAGIDLHRRSTRAHELSRLAQRTV
jgi:hypothetical protein